MKNELFYLVAHAATTPNDILLRISETNTNHHDFLVQKAFQGLYHTALSSIERGLFDPQTFASSFRKLYMIVHSDDTRQGMMLDLQRISDALGNAISLGPITDEFVSGFEILSVPPILRSIGNMFLCNCTNLRFIDLNPLSNVTAVGDGFLFGCSSLQMLDLGPLRNVTVIGDWFLNHCLSLQTLDLGPLRNVTSVGRCFLRRCSGLQTIDLSGLCEITSIPDGFLRECSNLRSLDLGPLCNVTAICDEFLSECSGLQALDLGPLRNVTIVGRWFLYGCSGLQTLDIGPLSNATLSDECFLLKTNMHVRVSRTQTNIIAQLHSLSYTVVE